MILRLYEIAKKDILALRVFGSAVGSGIAHRARPPLGPKQPLNFSRSSSLQSSLGSARVSASTPMLSAGMEKRGSYGCGSKFNSLNNFTWAAVMGHYFCGLLARETIVPTNANLQV